MNSIEYLEEAVASLFGNQCGRIDPFEPTRTTIQAEHQIIRELARKISPNNPLARYGMKSNTPPRPGDGFNPDDIPAYQYRFNDDNTTCGIISPIGQKFVICESTDSETLDKQDIRKLVDELNRLRSDIFAYKTEVKELRDELRDR